MSTQRREQLKRYAQRMLHRDGYARFGYGSVAEHFGVTRSAVQQALGKKDALVLELLAEADAALEAARRAEDVGADPRALLERFFDYSVAEYDAGLPMCIMGAVVSNYEVLPSTARALADRFTARLLEQLTDALERGRERGLYGFEGPACDKADFVVSAVRGARLLARQRGRAVLLSAIVGLREALAPSPHLR